ncbi:MAG TPA: DUF4410 domain-containing protein [Hydrogenophaga sp.]
MFSFFCRRLAAGAIPFVLAACGSTAVVLEKPTPTKPLETTYTTGYVQSVTTTLLNDDDPDERRLADKRSLEGRLPSVVRDALEEHGLTMSSGSDGRTPGTVAVVVDVKYNPGNRSLRWLAGPFGAGKGTMEVKIEARDVASGAVVATRSDTDTVHAGAFGGNFYEDVEDLVEDLAGDLAEDLTGKRR